LESYLKENNLRIYGPYLAENHANTDKPITVSFDPLDDSKNTNYGYKLVPKARLDFKGGFSILTYPLYETWVTSGIVDNQVVSRNIQRTYTGVSIFRYWSLGLDFSYPISSELSLGGEVNWNYSLSTGNGATITGIFLRMKLFDE
jgi:hypothetical protein